MAYCTNCGAEVPDGVPYCSVCGAPMTAASEQPAAPQQAYQAPQQYQPAADGFDHTAQFKKDDVRKHKAIAAVFYSMIMMTFFSAIDGWGLTSMFTRLIDDVVAMFTSGYLSGSLGSITGYAMIGVLAAVGTAAFRESDYVRFHGRMTFKLLFCSVIAYLVRIIPVIGPVLSLIFSWLIILIAFISVIFVLMGKSREPIVICYMFKE